MTLSTLVLYNISSRCPIDPNVLELDAGFSRDATLSARTNGGANVTTVYRTGVFQCKRYLRFSSDELNFDAYIKFCIGTYEQDIDCINVSITHD